MNSMRISPGFRTTVLLLAASIVPPLHAEQGLLTFVFGPSSQEAARQSARAAAATARHWLQTTGSGVQARRAGSAAARGPRPAAPPAPPRLSLQTAGSVVELRRAGSPVAQRIDAGMGVKELEQAFNDTALAARDADPPSFLISLR